MDIRLEKRLAPRRNTMIEATVIYDGGRSRARCIIRNLSDTGACLEIATGRVPDERFQLVIKPECLVRICEVAWRKAEKVGVRFV